MDQRRPEPLAAARRSSEDESGPRTGGRAPSASSSSSSAAGGPRSPGAAMRLPSPHHVGHRHSSSFSDSLRGIPPSPRGSRHPSVSGGGPPGADLLNFPPQPTAVNPQFAGRDWHSIAVGELVDPSGVVFVEVDTGIEEATNILIEAGTGVLVIRATAQDKAAVATFDYKDLNQYLLFATGGLRPDSDHLTSYQDLAKKAQAGKTIPLREAKSLGTKEPFVMLPHTAKLTKVVEAFGGGVHRLIVVKEWTNEVIGVLSQSRLVKFLWENGRCFPVIDQLYPQTIQDLSLGSQGNLISINGDRPLREALLLLDTEGVSSLAVLDAASNVIGNISTADVRLLTKASSAPLLDASCVHFISVILSSRGLVDGKDPMPVFHVAPHSTLAHVVAKLVATKAHRMWVTAPSSPAPSTPSTPGPVVASPWPGVNSSGGATLAPNSTLLATTPSPQAGAALPVLSTSPSLHHHYQPPRPSSPSLHPQSPPSPSFSSAFPSLGAAPSVGAAAMPGAHVSGRLAGVVSLSDTLNLFARASGLHPHDLGVVRRNRRTSSTSSLRSHGTSGSAPSGQGAGN